MKPLVIFCSGFGSPNGIEWKVSPIYQTIRACGLETKIWRNCNMGLVDIKHNAHCLADYICERDIDQEIFLVGHSMGGIVARLADSFIPPINGIVTLGTPHLGVASARLGAKWSKSARQMQTDSYLLRYLNDFKSTALYSIACRFDGIVVPFKNSISPQSTKVDVVSCTHLSVLLSRPVANKVRDWICSI